MVKMKTLVANGRNPVDTLHKEDKNALWTVREKLLLGLTFPEYIGQAIRNPF